MASAITDFRAQDVIVIAARLAQLLAEEVDLLKEMKIREIEKLQSEKIFLTNALDAQRKLLDAHPEFLAQANAEEKKNMEEIAQLFRNTMDQNHRQLLIAKEVNGQIVNAIRDVVRETTQSRTYNGYGYTGASSFNTLSVTLNKMI